LKLGAGLKIVSSWAELRRALRGLRSRRTRPTLIPNCSCALTLWL